MVVHFCSSLDAPVPVVYESPRNATVSGSSVSSADALGVVEGVGAVAVVDGAT